MLNLLSTTTMVRLGRVYDNWMIYVALTNQKLLRRGQRILTEAAAVSASTAAHALRQTRHDLPAALVMLKTGTSADVARKSLASAGGNIKRALELNGKERPSTKGKGK